MTSYTDTELHEHIQDLVKKIETRPASEWHELLTYLLSRFDDKDQSWEARDAYTRIVLEPLRKTLSIRIQQDRW